MYLQLRQEYHSNNLESSHESSVGAGDSFGFGGKKPTGLSPAHISPFFGSGRPLRRQPHFKTSPQLRAASAIFYAGGSLIQVKKSRIVLGSSIVGGGVRGRVRGFSRASRRRLYRKLAVIDQAAVPIFVTLTYPAEWPESPEVWKLHFDKWCKRLHRRFAAAGLVWKLEAQRRGAPHFHCLVWGASYVDLLVWASAAWYASVGSCDQRHLRAGVRVEQIRSWRGVRSYASKYMAKGGLPDAWVYPGRIWGVRYADNIPWAQAVRVQTSDRQASRLMRYLRRYAGLRHRSTHSAMSVMVNDASQWLIRSHDLLGVQC